MFQELSHSVDMFRSSLGKAAPTRRVIITASLAYLVTMAGAIAPAYGQSTKDAPANQQSSATDNAATAAKPAKPTADDPQWTLHWSDEFDGDKLDGDKWKFETGAHGFGNAEWQNYTDGDNLEISEGTLKITAKKVGEGQKVGDYTSTRLNSKSSFLYGRMEIRAKMPAHKGKGIWPAIWMLGKDIKTQGWPKCGELDIMEYVSYLPNTTHSAIHSQANNHVDGTQVESGPVKLETAEEQFHIYGLQWDEDQLIFYTDVPSNVKLSFKRPENPTQDNWPFASPEYFLLNVAVGGGWGGRQGVDDTIFPATMEVDYVRVYKRKK